MSIQRVGVWKSWFVQQGCITVCTLYCNHSVSLLFVIFPLFHFCLNSGLCMECAMQIEQCPLCRMKIKERVSLFQTDPVTEQGDTG